MAQRHHQDTADRLHLLKQKRAWYVRLAVPRDLRRLFQDRPEVRPAGIGKYEAVMALKTTDLTVARQRRWAAIARIKATFEDLRARYAPGAEDGGRAAFHATLERLRANAKDWDEDSRQELLERLDDALQDRPGQGEFGGGPGTPVWDATAEFLQPGQHPEAAAYAPTVAELAERYLKDRARDPDARVTAQTAAQERACLDLFAAWHAGPVATVTPQVATEFLDAISGLDPLWGRSPAKRAVTLDQLRAHALVPHEGGLAGRTMNRYISTMASFMAWAAKRHPGISKAAFAGHWRKPASYRKTGWLPMTDDEVLTILDHCSTLPEASAMRWVPLICAYAGTRTGEVCGRMAKDVVQRDGVWCLHVTDAKTAAGDRLIPLHSEIIKAGFVEYVQGLPKDGQLFPSLRPGGPDGKLNWSFTAEFTRLRRKLGITRDRISAHSLRKAVGTKLERARVPESEAVQLLGHERLSMSYSVYSLGLTVAQLREIVELIRYDGAGQSGGTWHS